MPTREGPDQNVALFCDESGTPVFHLRLLMRSGTSARIDTRFLDVCVPGSIHVSSIVAPILTRTAGFIDGFGENVVTLADEQCELRVTLTGIRRGREGVSFPRKTDEEMANNNAFWDQSKNPRPGI
jgi:hypothetical protein